MAADGANAGVTGTAGGAAGAAPAVTAAQARQAFAHYVAVTSRASGPGSAAALSVLTGVERSVAVAARTSDRITLQDGADPGGSSAYSSSLSVTLTGASYSYGTPAFFIPERSGYPRFFVAYTARRVKGIPLADDLSRRVGGVRVALDGPVLMLFLQQSAGAPWKLASASQLPAGQPLPALARDAGGYVPQVALSAADLLIRPSEAGALQAAVVDDGPASPASRAVAAGPLTTGMYQGSRTRTLGLEPPGGDVYQWTLQGSSLPAFALRTEDGGALVFYTMTLNTTVAVPDIINKADPIRPGRPIQVPDSVLPLLPAGTPTAPREQLQSQETLSFTAVDPPGSNGKLRVVGIGGGLTSASAS